MNLIKTDIRFHSKASGKSVYGLANKPKRMKSVARAGWGKGNQRVEQILHGETAFPFTSVVSYACSLLEVFRPSCFFSIFTFQACAVVG
jgi:hypothetical protein